MMLNLPYRNLGSQQSPALRNIPIVSPSAFLIEMLDWHETLSAPPVSLRSKLRKADLYG